VIDLGPREIIATRHTDDGRFVIFSSAGVTAGWPLPFWGVIADTGADGHGLLVRLDAMVACDGWTVPQLLTVVHARLVAEQARFAAGSTEAAIACLDRALAVYADVSAASSPAVTFEPGDPASPYPCTVARCGPFALPLCPDPESRGEGVTPEQLLIILDQMLLEWSRHAPYIRRVWALRKAVKEALVAEVARVEAARARSPAAGLSG
jgi:hypothetical protein